MLNKQVSTTVEQKTLSVAFFTRLYIPFAAGYFISVLFRTINSTIAPHLIKDFGLSATELGLMTSTYMLSFAFAQYPLGISLDRFGSKRTLITLMSVACIGSLLFGIASDFNGLIIGRMLMGLGVSGCLMCAFKAYSDWLPAERLPIANAFQLFAGGCGSLVATGAVGTALNYTDWRTVFMFLALLCFLVILLIFFLAPQKAHSRDRTSLRQQIIESIQIVKSPDFWRLAPFATLMQATYVSLQSLWIAPWFRDVGGVAEIQIPYYLFWFSLAITAGFILNGVICDYLRRFRITAYAFSIVSMIISLFTFGVIILLGTKVNFVLWWIMIFTATASMVTYPVFTSMFAPNLSGRVITIANLLCFLVTFLLQWGIGIIIDLYPVNAGHYSISGYTTAFLILFFLNVLSLIWLIIYKKGRMILLSGREPIN
jgi:predicted MFS family arabinose efflux permease